MKACGEKADLRWLTAWQYFCVAKGERHCVSAVAFMVAGGGFVPQSLIHSVQLTDSTMVRNAEKGDKGELFIQSSFSFRHRHEQKQWRGPKVQRAKIASQTQVS